MSRARTAARWTLRIAIVLVATLVLVYLLRRPLFESWILAQVRSELAAALDATVEVEALEGNWLTSARVVGLTIRSADGPVRVLENATATADYSLLALARGDLGGLRRAAVTASVLHVVLPAAGAEPAPEAAPAEPVDVGSLLALLPEGATVRVDTLVIGSGPDARRGGLSASVAPRDGATRSATIDAADVQATATASAEQAEAKATVAEPAELARALGVELPIAGGALALTARYAFTTGAAAGQAKLERATTKGRAIERAELKFALRDDRLELREAEVDAPGIAVTGGDFVVPLGAGDVIAMGDGKLDVAIKDLTPYASLMPAELRRLMPLTARASCRIGPEGLRVSRLEVAARGAVASIESVRVPLDVLRGTAPWAAEASAQVALTVTDGTAWHDLVPSPELRAYLPSSAKLAARLAGGRVTIERFDAESASAALACRDASLPLAQILDDAGSTGSTGSAANAAHGRDGLPAWLRDASARLVLEVRDLAAYADLAPEDLRPYLTGTARIAGNVAAGVVKLEESYAALEGIRVEVGPGQLLLGASDERLGEIDVSVRIAEPRTFHVPELGELRLAALVTAKVTGSPSAPIASGRLHVSELVHDLARIGELDARFAFAEGTLRVTELAAVRIGASAGAARSTLAGRFTLELPRAPRRELRVQANLKGMADPSLASMLELSEAELARLSPASYAVDAELELPSRAGAPPRGKASLKIAGLSVDGRAPLALVARGAIDGTSTLVLETLELTTPEETIAVRASGRMPLAGDGNVALSFQADPVDLAAAGALAGLALHGNASLTLDVTGTVAEPKAALDLAARVEGAGAKLAGAWPDPLLGDVPAGPAVVRVRAGGGRDGIRVETLRVDLGEESGARAHLEGAGDLPLRVAPSGEIALREVRDAFAARLTVDAPQAATGSVALKAALELDARGARLSSVDLRAGDSALKGHVELALPEDAVLGDPATLLAARLDGELTIDRLALERLGSDLAGLAQLEGHATGRARVGGTLAAPLPEVELSFADVALKASGLQRIEGASGGLRVRPGGVEIERIRAKMGAGPIEISGALRGEGTPFWQAIDAAALDLTVRTRDALVYRMGGVKVRGDADITVTGPLSRIAVEGSFAVTSGKFVRRLSVLPSLSTHGGMVADRGFSPISIPGDLGERLRFDIALTTREPFEVVAHVVDIDLNAQLRLKGPGTRTWLEGNVSGSEGKVRLPGATLDIESALVSFTKDQPFTPRLLARASGRRMGVRVQATVQGNYDQPEVLLSSVPPYPPEDLIVLLTTGVLPEDARARGLRGNATLVGTYAAGEVIAFLFGSESTEAQQSLVDRLTIESGQDVSQNGLETLRAQFELSEHFFIEAERDVYEDYNFGVIFRIRF